MGTPWDKRLTMQQWQALIDGLWLLNRDQVTGNRMRRAVSEALAAVTNSPADFYIALDDARLLEGAAHAQQSTSQTGPSIRLGSLPPRFHQYVNRQGSQGMERQGSGMYPGLPAMPWHDSQRCPVAVALEEMADRVAAELAGLSSRMFRDEAEQIARVGRWSVVFLMKEGKRCGDVCDLCPITTSILDAHADEMHMSGMAYFSCLDPGTRVAPHRGPTNTRLRCHVGIEVPDDCGLKVGGIEGVWGRGRCIVFDDSFIHEVWNSSPHRRVVLVVDIWHPDLSSDEIALLQWISA